MKYILLIWEKVKNRSALSCHDNKDETKEEQVIPKLKL